MNKINIGDIYGKWTVIGPPHRKGPTRAGRNHYCMCRCECGTEKEVSVQHLCSGTSVQCRSCGSKNAGAATMGIRHGEFPYLPKTLIERVRGAAWNAIYRCTDHENRKYQDYGGRGIEVRFLDVNEFVRHLLTLPGHDNPLLVLDRIDNNGHYEVGNLRYTTYSESSCNSRPKRSRYA
jgi:hypothetical protein